MRSMTVSCLVAAICSITAAASEASVASSVANVLTESPAVPTPLTDKVETEDEVHAELELRQATGIVTGATQAALQYPSVTVQFLQTVVPGGATTYLPFTYTQTFASFPDNWATIPIPAGQIGYGTLTKGKRDAEPTGNVQGIAGRIRA